MSDLDYPQGACVVVCDINRKILGVTRPDGQTYGLPGGKVDPGENFEQAACRELWEETGLIVTPEKLVPLYRGVCGADSAGGIMYDVMSFLVVAYEGRLLRREENVIPAWLEWDPYFLRLSPFEDYNRQVAMSAIRKFPSMDQHFSGNIIKPNNVSL